VFLPFLVGEGGNLSEQLWFVIFEELHPGVLMLDLLLAKHIHQVIIELHCSWAGSRAVRGCLFGCGRPRVTAMDYDRYTW
jgi:hypothetical protein